MQTSKPHLWTHKFILIMITSYFLVFSYFLSMSTLAIYAIDEFNASESDAGLAASIFVLGLVVARLFGGKYIEIIGRQKLAYIGLIFNFLIALLYLLVTNLDLFIFVRFMNGIAVGLVLTALQTAVIDIIPTERQGEGLSYYTLNFILGTATGPLIGIIIIQNANMNTIFIVSALVAIISLILAMISRIPEAEISKEQLEEMKGFHLKNFVEVKALPIAILMGFIAFSYSSVTTFLTAYSLEIQLMSAASMFFIVFSVMNFISRPICGKLFDTKGANIVMYPSLVLFAIGFLFVSQAQYGFILLIGAALIGLGYGNINTSALAIAIKRTPRYRAGLANSTFFMVVETGLGIGPFILGYLIPILGYRHLYLVLAIFSLFCVVLYYLVHGNRKEMNRQVSQANLKH